MRIRRDGYARVVMAEPPPRPPEDDETVVVPPDETVVEPRWEVAPERRVAVAETREEHVPPPRRMPRLWPALLALLVLVLAGIGAAYYFSQDDDGAAATTTASGSVVPLVVGLREDRARERLRDEGLEAEVERRESSEPRDVVVEQDPEQGARLESGEAVRLVVSEGRPGATTGATTAPAEAVRVPEVVGASVSDATERLQAAGLGVRLVQVPSDEPEGTVVGQSPAAGAEAERGSDVRLNVAEQPTTTTTATTTTAPPEPQPATVPEVVGQELAQAARAFAEEGLKVSVRYVPSREAQGRVVAQAQPAGTERRRGDTVQVNVSEGAEPAEDASVPAVAGQRLDEARQALDAAGFEVLAIDLAGEVRNGDRVASQSPAGSATIPRGSLVLLYLTG